FLLLDDRHAGHLLDRRCGLGLRLVVPVVVAWADVDHADHQLVGGVSAANAETPDGRERTGNAELLEHRATVDAMDRRVTHFALSWEKVEDGTNQGRAVISKE